MGEYYRIYFSTLFKLLFRKSIAWKIFLLSLSLLCGAIVSYLWKGKDFVVEQTFTFFAFSILPLVVLALAYLVFSLLQTPVKIYQTQAHEIEKYGWQKVEFSHVGYSINNVSGLAIEIDNKKDFDITEIVVEMARIRIGRKLVSLSASGVHRLGYIERDKDQPEDVIIKSLDPVNIEAGEKKEFVVTEVAQTMPMISITRKFSTYPDDTEWPFFPTSEDGLLGSLGNISRILARQYTADIPLSQPRVIIEIEVKGKIVADDETVTLPTYALNLEMFSDGSLSWDVGDQENEK